MIKKISSLFLISTLLVGCGGSSGGKKTPDNNPPSSTSTSSSVSSTPASSEPASSAPSSSAVSSSEPASSSSSSSSEANVIIADMTKNWRGNGEGNAGVSYDQGVLFNALGQGVGAVIDLEAPINLENAVIEVVLNVSPEFKASGASIQPFAQIKETWKGKWCDVPSESLTASEDYTATCTVDMAEFNQSENGVQVGVQASGDSPTGLVTIKSLKITLASGGDSSSSSSSNSSSSAASNLSVDFEADTAGATYGGIGWASTDLTATVVAISSVTGLPSNGSSTKVLKVEAANYNAVPVFNVSLPAGKTLNDYNIKVDAYFPSEGDNSYKPFLLLAGTTITGEASTNNAAYQATINTGPADIDVWKTFTFTADSAKGSSLTGDIQVAVGISRGKTTNDPYYLDNVKLELK